MADPIVKQIPPGVGIDFVDASQAKVELEVMPPANMTATGSFMYDVDATIEKAVVTLAEIRALIKQFEPRDGMTNDQLRVARDKRSSRFGVEVLETGSKLSFGADRPTKLSEYGDPVNLKFPVDTVGRARNARVRFKQFAGSYDRTSSKKVVHTRIVEAELAFGVSPSIDSDDSLDQLLPAALRQRAERAGE